MNPGLVNGWIFTGYRSEYVNEIQKQVFCGLSKTRTFRIDEVYMDTISWMLEILDRAHTGPIFTSERWDMEVVRKKSAAILETHKLKKTFNPEEPINCDDALADAFYAAGLDLAHEVGGIFCIDTERVIEVTAEEIADGIASQPGNVSLGSGKEQFTRRHRFPEDKTPPMFAALVGTPISEDIYLDLTAALAAIPEIDSLTGGTIYTLFGREILGGTPYETLAGRHEARLNKEAVRRAGRPGMSLTATEMSPTAYGLIASLGQPDGYAPDADEGLALSPSEMRTSYDVLHKVIHIHMCGGVIRGGSPAMIFGYAGGPEGAAVTNIASSILQRTIIRSIIGDGHAYDIRYLGNCGRHGLWTLSVINQGLTRNTNFMTGPLVEQRAGPNTEMLLLESAVGLINLNVSGASGTLGPRSAGGALLDYITPLETKFCAEVFKSASGMTRHQANEIAKVLLPRYENQLNNPPLGQTIQECYDIETMTPHDNYLQKYYKIKEELIDLGVPLKI
jgi:methylamine---corrinoid protein Co-methyltransferase